jgi:hypothetical protein
MNCDSDTALPCDDKTDDLGTKLGPRLQNLVIPFGRSAVRYALLVGSIISPVKVHPKSRHLDYPLKALTIPEGSKFHQ